MIKWPEPALVNEIRYSGIAVNKMVTENLYTEAQLKQAVRDFGEQCAQACAAEAEGRGDEDAFVAKLCAAAIRALIKEIPE